ncbi:nucleoside triphosphate pyrophosphohydrolase [Paraburkholderia sediminicola]|uniref:nucleoside triphosphate pyrophosphohydrolase n=1 Tax=Paraburkholderia sediminicola TaxID=458836 RepID=UPI0038B89D63
MAKNKSTPQRSRDAAPSPKNPLNIVTTDGLRLLEPDDITHSEVGWKAFGLSTLPAEWVPPYFVISGNCLTGAHDQATEDSIVLAIRTALSTVDLAEHASVFIRSSGVAETLDARGQLDSLECPARDTWLRAKELMGRLTETAKAKGDSGAIHLVVQKSVVVAEKGHMSNERRLSYEPRDWVAEFEPVNGEVGRTEPVAVRTWRSGKALNTARLICDARPAIGIVLKRVGSWSMQFSSRMHFEWVWDGRVVWLVQADRAAVSGGIDPRSVIPRHIPQINTDRLRAFRPVNEQDFATYGKLRNAKLYADLGYRMPPFYILNEPAVISALLSGIVTDDLAADLGFLTQRPFIIRTDGTDIPATKREMLPRSDELRSLADAKGWLTTTFARFVLESDLQGAGLCLIAHHFIPSVASAWARAEPGNPIVRIESLWGNPEGLYWHSHDTFEVDTGGRSIQVSEIGGDLHYGLRERLRFKGTFIAADEAGRWIPQVTDSAHDWSRSITRTQWIFEIAQTTRRIAERREEAICVMWFVDNHQDATSHRVLPWFHSSSSISGGPKAAPRRKRVSAHEVVIRHREDWEQLKKSADAGESIERVVMAPVDAELIRNASFASELAQLARKIGFVVELSGGILSHAYYMLSREGCSVECVDLFGTGEEVVEFHKLVRDGIPDLIRERGERVESIALKGDALVSALRQKLVEEAFEALDARTGDDLMGELADVQEVLLALAAALNIDHASLEQERLKKRKKRGGFDAGLMLLKTATPQSIARLPGERRTSDGDLAMEDSLNQSAPVISEPMALPPKTPYRRPDLRNVEGGMEKLFTFKTDIESLNDHQQRLTFDMPVPKAGNNSFVLTVELDRVKAAVRGKISLQLGPTQLELPFQQ